MAGLSPHCLAQFQSTLRSQMPASELGLQNEAERSTPFVPRGSGARNVVADGDPVGIGPSLSLPLSRVACRVVSRSNRQIGILAAAAAAAGGKFLAYHRRWRRRRRRRRSRQSREPQLNLTRKSKHGAKNGHCEFAFFGVSLSVRPSTAVAFLIRLERNESGLALRKAAR